MDLRTKILGSPKLATESLHVPEWGATVTVKAWTGRQRWEFEQSVQAATKDAKHLEVMAAAIIMSVYGDDGKPLFQKEDAEQLLEQPCDVLLRVYEVVSRLNAIAPGDVEDIRKNSPAPVCGASSSSSHYVLTEPLPNCSTVSTAAS